MNSYEKVTGHSVLELGGRLHWMFLLLCLCSCASSFRRPQMRESVYKSPGCANN